MVVTYRHRHRSWRTKECMCVERGDSFGSGFKWRKPLQRLKLKGSSVVKKGGRKSWSKRDPSVLKQEYVYGITLVNRKKYKDPTEVNPPSVKETWESHSISKQEMSIEDWRMDTCEIQTRGRKMEWTLFEEMSKKEREKLVGSSSSNRTFLGEEQ